MAKAWTESKEMHCTKIHILYHLSNEKNNWKFHSNHNKLCIYKKKTFLYTLHTFKQWIVLF